MIGFGEFPRPLGVSNVKANLSDVIPGRKFDRRPNRAVEVNVVVFEVIESAKLVGLVDPEAEGNVDRAVVVATEPSGLMGSGGASQPLLTCSMASFQRVSALRKPDALERDV